MSDELIRRAKGLRHRLEALVPELDRIRAELREVVTELAEAGVSDDEIAAATGIHPRKVHRIGKGLDELVVCAFCRANRSQVDKIVAGPGLYICDGCIRGAGLRPPTDEACSFCNKGAGEMTGVLVAPDGRAAMCDECLALCQEIIAEDLGGAQP